MFLYYYFVLGHHNGKIKHKFSRAKQRKQCIIGTRCAWQLFLALENHNVLFLLCLFSSFFLFFAQLSSFYCPNGFGLCFIRFTHNIITDSFGQLRSSKTLHVICHAFSECECVCESECFAVTIDNMQQCKSRLSHYYFLIVWIAFGVRSVNLTRFVIYSDMDCHF